jgi:hypothetical protein
MPAMYGCMLPLRGRMPQTGGLSRGRRQRFLQPKCDRYGIRYTTKTGNRHAFVPMIGTEPLRFLD